MDQSQSPSRNAVGPIRAHRLALLSLLVLVPAIFAPLVNHLILSPDGSTVAANTDYPVHNALAARMRLEGQIVLPHPLYHALVIGAQVFRERFGGAAVAAPIELDGADTVESRASHPNLPVVNEQYRLPSVVVCVASLLLLAIVLWVQITRVMPARGAPLAVPLVLTLMLVAPAALLFNGDERFYFGYIGINTWHNPTALLAKPLAIFTFIAILPVFPRETKPGMPCPALAWASSVSLALATALSALAKPSYLLCLFPAAMLVASYRIVVSRRAVHWRVLLLALVLPAALILGWQSTIYRRFFPGVHPTLAPGVAMSWLSGELPTKFMCSILFPLACYAAWWRDARRSFRLNFAWVVFAFGVAYTYLLAESVHPWYGNYLWTGQLALFVLFVESALFALAHLRRTGVDHLARRAPAAGIPRLNWRAAACATVLALHLVYGIAYYVRLISTPSTQAGIYR